MAGHEWERGGAWGVRTADEIKRDQDSARAEDATANKIKLTSALKESRQ